MNKETQTNAQLLFLSLAHSLFSDLFTFDLLSCKNKKAILSVDLKTKHDNWLLYIYDQIKQH